MVKPMTDLYMNFARSSINTLGKQKIINNQTSLAMLPEFSEEKIEQLSLQIPESLPKFKTYATSAAKTKLKR